MVGRDCRDHGRPGWRPVHRGPDLWCEVDAAGNEKAPGLDEARGVGNDGECLLEVLEGELKTLSVLLSQGLRIYAEAQITIELGAFSEGLQSRNECRHDAPPSRSTGRAGHRHRIVSIRSRTAICPAESHRSVREPRSGAPSLAG